MNRIDIMIDLETLGVEDNATVIQIGAIAFDISDGRAIKEFNKKILIDSVDASKFEVDMNTLKWWLKTNPQLLAELTTGKDCVKQIDAWTSFNEFVDDCSELCGNVYLWGNGSLFDNAKVIYNLKALGLEDKFHYSKHRDVRTILDLGCECTGFTEKEFKEEFEDVNEVKHDALDDCRFQIRYVSGAYQILTK